MATNQLKVLLLSNYLKGEFDSGYRIRYHTAEILANDSNIDVTIIFPATKPFSYSFQQPKKNFKVIETPGLFPTRFRRGGFSFFDLIFKIFFSLKKKYDVIHVDMGHRPAGFIPAYLGQKINKSIIINEWWDWFGRGGMADFRKDNFLQKYISLYDNRFEVAVTKKFDGVIAIATALKKTLSNNDIYEKTIVLYGGAETSNLQSTDIIKARSMLGLKQNSITIGMINICEEDEEDNKIFWKAFSKLANKYDQLLLLVTGKQDYVRNKFIPSVTFKDRIIYPGWVDRKDYALCLSSCDMFVLPLRSTFRNEARWPNKLSDYFAIKRPVLTNPTGDLKYVFEKHRLGFLCETDVEDFYKKTKFMIENKEQREACCADQWEFSHNELDFNNRVKKIRDFYINLLAVI